MDMLSNVVSTMRAGRAKFARTRRTGPWGNSFGPYPGAGIHVLLQGSCWLIPPSSEPVELRAGDVVFLPHGSRHAMSDSPNRRIDELPPATPEGSDEDPGPTAVGEGVELLCGAYRLDRSQVHPLLRTLPDAVTLPSGSHSALHGAVELLAADHSRPRPGSDAALPALLDLLLVYVLRGWLDDETVRHPGRGWPTALTDPLLVTALSNIHSDPAYQWTVSELGATVGLSKTTFARRFKSLTGQPPLAYLTWCRLNNGARLLRVTDAPLATVARQVGYASEFAFANAFRREFGIAPGRFRREAADDTESATDPILPQVGHVAQR